MNTSSSNSISKTIAFVKEELANAEGGHDWWHIYRVHKMAKTIATKETVNLEIVELAALLHDIADPKFHDGDESVGPNKARAFMESIEIEASTIEHVISIIKNMSFKNSLGEINFHSPELAVVQDADRLDAIGAIGIARVFNFGGYKGNPIHVPGEKPKLNMSKEEYKKSNGTSVNHFYEKLLLLKSKMNTQTGTRLAEERHRYMEEYLERLFSEFEGKV